MSKYKKVLIKRKARAGKICSYCGKEIKAGEYYLSEEPSNRFLHTIHNKKFHIKCTNDGNQTL